MQYNFQALPNLSTWVVMGLMCGRCNGLFAIFVTVNLILPLRKKQRILRQLKRRMTLDEEIKSEDSQSS